MSGQSYSKLKKEWYAKLKASGFEDLEDSQGRLKQHDIRTQLYLNRERIRDFFLALDAYLEANKLPTRDRAILELYSSGAHLVDISKRVGFGLTVVKAVIRRYKLIIVGKA